MNVNNMSINDMTTHNINNDTILNLFRNINKYKSHQIINFITNNIKDLSVKYGKKELTLLMLVMYYGTKNSIIKIIEFILDRMTIDNINLQNKNGITALMFYVINYNDVRIFNKFISIGADINIITHAGYNVLNHALLNEESNMEIINKLVQLNIKLITKQNCKPYLYYAIKNIHLKHNPNLINYLLDNSDSNAFQYILSDNINLLSYALIKKYPDEICYKIATKLDPNTIFDENIYNKDKYYNISNKKYSGKNSIYFCFKNKYFKTANYLLELYNKHSNNHLLQKTIIDNNIELPLYFMAAYSNDNLLIDYMLKYIDKPELSDEEGYNFYIYVLKNYNYDNKYEIMFEFQIKEYNEYKTLIKK